MKKIIFGLFVSFVLFSCDENEQISLNNENYLVFGHFYGMCVGEGCVETFQLTNKGLFEDTLDDYNGENFQFVPLSNEKYNQVKDLVTFFPDDLLSEKEPIIGCPDCADGGGLFVLYNKNGNIQRWRIDQNKSNVPKYLHPFMDKLNEKIALINN